MHIGHINQKSNSYTIAKPHTTIKKLSNLFNGFDTRIDKDNISQRFNNLFKRFENTAIEVVQILIDYSKSKKFNTVDGRNETLCKLDALPDNRDENSTAITKIEALILIEDKDFNGKEYLINYLIKLKEERPEVFLKIIRPIDIKAIFN